MVPGLAGEKYEEMVAELGLDWRSDGTKQTSPWCTILCTTKGQLDHTCWFEKAADGRRRANRNSTDPLNLRGNHGRLGLRRNFFSVRVIDSWKRIPGDKHKKWPKDCHFSLQIQEMESIPDTTRSWESGLMRKESWERDHHGLKVPWEALSRLWGPTPQEN